MVMKIYISRYAAERIFQEVFYWVNDGILKSGTARESLVYPLSCIFSKDGKLLRSPLETAGISDIGALAIDDVAVPPEDVKVFSSHNCHFNATEQDNREFNKSIDVILQKRPRLEVLSKMHSHPFSYGGFLSEGDIYYGHQARTASQWRSSRGLAISVLQVVYPDSTPQYHRYWDLNNQGAYGITGSGKEIQWRIKSWAFCGSYQWELGDAEIVANKHPYIKSCRRQPYWTKSWGAKWCDNQKERLRASPLVQRVARASLTRGWRRYAIETASGVFVIALPPDLPKVPISLLAQKNGKLETMDLPKNFIYNKLKEIDLLELTKWFIRSS